MRLPFIRPRKDESISERELESIRSIFSKFRRIQKLNTRILEGMAEMEQALGGEYIFDRAFLESSVRQLSRLTYQVVYSLNAMSRNRDVVLFDQYQSIKSILDDILSGGFGPFASCLTLPYSALGWEMEPLVGTLNVCLAEARHRLDLLAPDGFAVTATGCRLFPEGGGIPGTSVQTRSMEQDEALHGHRLPSLLEEAITKELKSLLARNPELKRVKVRVCTVGGHNPVEPALEAEAEALPEKTLEACRRVLAAQLAGSPSSPCAEFPPFALAVHEAVSAVVAGTIKGQAAAGFPAGLFSITAAPVDAPHRVEHYLVRRIHPYGPIRWEPHAPCGRQTSVPPARALSRGSTGLYRGSSLLEPAFLKAVAEGAMAIERTLGCVQELHWVRGKGDGPVFVDIRPCVETQESGTEACAIGSGPHGAEVLLDGGTTVQAGIAAGCAVHVLEGSPMESFPHGAIAIARGASPRLSLVLRRASAIVTELGSSVSHLATVARELRIPAIFGASHALVKIPDGTEVTVDAGERTVYRGVLEPLLACREYGGELYPSDPEYVSLRRLLRWIMPLGLTDSELDSFKAENCQTYHDIIHYAHERSVEELLRIRERGRGLGACHARRVELGLPMDLFAIDLGGGIHPDGADPITPKDILSEPFQAFLGGLMRQDMWSSAPGSLRLRDILSGLDRTFEAMTAPPDFGGMNHAIVAESYMNLGLRMGYHFSVVDTYLGNNIHQNYIYFRFVGGFADDGRRRLRADLIRTLLEEKHFQVTVKGDLVVGKLKIAAREELKAALVMLGELTGFTRQLDLSMTSEEKVLEFARLFRKKSVCGDTEEPGDV